jgi:uncharacterized protein (TIGR03000 family)
MLAMTTAADSADFGRRGGGGCCGGGYYGGGCSGYYGGCSGYGGGGYRAGSGSYGPTYAVSPFGGYYYGPNGMIQTQGGYYAPSGAYQNQSGFYGTNQTQGTDVRQSFYPSSGQENSAMVRVLLPNPEAEVWFDGSATKQRGFDRFFTSPPLDTTTNSNYRYTIKARWNENGKQIDQERRVDVRAGQPVTVDFRSNTNQGQGERLPNPNNPNNPINPNNPNKTTPNPNKTTTQSNPPTSK